MISTKPFYRNNNGNRAFLELYKHNMGSSKWDTIVVNLLYEIKSGMGGTYVTRYINILAVIATTMVI